MAKTRVKKVVVSGVTRDQMEEAFGAFAFADAKLQGINAAMDAEITKIRERNAEEIAKFQQQKDDALEVMQTFATENRDELFSKRKAWRRRTASSGSAPGHRSSKPARALRGRRCWSCSKSSTRRMSAPARRSPKTSSSPIVRTRTCPS